ncbi:GNAT family N-acetyltransferase [Pseudonocardia sp. CNS-139]|nr:GNAT family N-acetyltransferase [Pseudonocardia sp. CNS-139]
MLDLRVIPFDHPDAVGLDGEIQEFYARVYGGEDSTAMDAREFAAPLGHFLVGYEDGEPVACGGWRRRDGGDPALLPGDAELKRMYVVQGRRGLGYARAVLAELERTAAAAGRRRLVLETGIRQPDAIALYTRAGYAPMPPFGDYRNSPASRCYAKALDPPPA